MAASKQSGDDVMTTVGQKVEKLKTENLALCSKVFAEKSAYARASLNNARLQ